MEALGHNPHNVSPVVAAAVKHLKAFGAALRSVGPVNTNETSAEHRRVLVSFAKPEARARMKANFRAHKLSF